MLRECLYRGADRAILITDRRAAASDTLATSYILSQAIRTIGRYDLVFCGRQAIDGDTAQVGPQCAEKLGIPADHLSGAARRPRTATRSAFAATSATAGRSSRPGCRLLVTVLHTANQPRPPSVKRVMRFKRARGAGRAGRRELDQTMPEVPLGDGGRRPWRELGLLIEQWDLDEIGADLDRCGLAGSPTKVHRVQAIVLTKEGYTEILPTEEDVRRLIHELVVDRTWG